MGFLFTRLHSIVHLSSLLKKKNKKLAKICTTSMALAVVWITMGLWHGANYTFLFFGLYYAVMMIVAYAYEVLWKKNASGPMQKNWLTDVLRMLRIFAIVCLGYIIFNECRYWNGGIVAEIRPYNGLSHQNCESII